jgi:hypothetical protein
LNSLGTDIFIIDNTHHAEGLVDPNLMNKKTVTGFRYPRACRIRKYQIENRSDHGSSAYQLFSKRFSANKMASSVNVLPRRSIPEAVPMAEATAKVFQPGHAS